MVLKSAVSWNRSNQKGKLKKKKESEQLLREELADVLDNV